MDLFTKLTDCHMGINGNINWTLMRRAILDEHLYTKNFLLSRYGWWTRTWEYFRLYLSSTRS